MKKSKNKKHAIVFKLILSRPESFFNLQVELKEETSVDTDHEKPNFQKNIGEKWVSTILTNPFDKKVGPFFYGHGFAGNPSEDVKKLDFVSVTSQPRLNNWVRAGVDRS